jgi:hypothetical protein
MCLPENLILSNKCVPQNDTIYIREQISGFIMFQQIANIDSKMFREWVSNETRWVSDSGTVHNRRDRIWYGDGSSDAYPMPRGFQQLSVVWGDDSWNSVLLYRFNTGSFLPAQQSSAAYHPRTIIINVGDTKIFTGSYNMTLTDGGVYVIDSRYPFGVGASNQVRYLLLVRRVK